MKENRSFDHLLGRLSRQGQPGAEAVPASFSNPDLNGTPVAPYHQSTTCISHDPNHQWDAMHTCVDGGRMDNFVKTAAATTGTNGHFAVSYYEQADLPFYYWLATTWALNDRHFASMRAGTNPNRAFLVLGTNKGIKNGETVLPDASTPAVFELLESAGYTWGAYGDTALFNGAVDWTHDDRCGYCFDDFMQRLDSGTLPNVAFVDGIDTVEDDHPSADIQRGEAWVRRIYRHAIKSPQWPRMAIIWTYDEGGAFADHVPPPDHACVARPGVAGDSAFTELGPRVPFVVISPYAKPHSVSHVVQEHTAITRFIETVFDLPALTSRDANSDALLDMFDFSCTPPMLNPPSPPGSGEGGCAYTGVIPLDIGQGM